jgi:hypothetical protein
MREEQQLGCLAVVVSAFVTAIILWGIWEAWK